MTRGDLRDRYYYEFEESFGQETSLASIHDRTGRFGRHGTIMCRGVAVETAERIVSALNTDERRRLMTRETDRRNAQRHSARRRV